MSPSKKRLDILDGWRSLAVLTMLFWHFFWDLTLFGLLPPAAMQTPFAQGVRYFIVCSFVLLSGIACRLSHSNLRRGLVTLGAAVLVTLGSWLGGDIVRFGILHFMSCAMLVYAAVGKYYERLPLWAALPLTALFLYLLPVMQAARVEVTWLWPLGLRTAEFTSGDYYPLLPWLLLFFAGSSLGGLLLKSGGRWRELALPPALTWPGRHALLIYLVHQPVYFGLLTLLTR